MDLIKIIVENFAISFCGRINLLQRENNQFLGVILQLDGMIVGAEYAELKGKKALATILMEMRSGKNFTCVSEPEIVSSIDFKMNEQQFFKFKNEYFDQFDQLQKLRPANDLKFLLDVKKMGIYTYLSKNEFEVMLCVIDSPVVKNLYKDCDLLDFDITNALISLRKKGVILVYK